MILYFDTETTGLRPGKICQLSYILDYGAGKIESKNFFFTVDYIEPSAIAVHGFSVPILKRLSGGKTFSDYAEEIANDFKSASIIIAHNISFDLSFLRKEFEEIGAFFCYKNECCSMKTAVPVTKILRSNGKGYKYPKLIELCEFLDITEIDIVGKEKLLFGAFSHSHDARFDTTALYLCVDLLMNTSKDFAFLKEFN